MQYSWLQSHKKSLTAQTLVWNISHSKAIYITASTLMGIRLPFKIYALITNKDFSVGEYI